MPKQLNATDRARLFSARHFPSSMRLFDHYRKSAVPEGGWVQEEFVGEAKTALQQDFLMARRSVILRGLRNLTPALTKLMREQVEAVVRTALESFSRLYGIPVKAWDSKAAIEFDVPNEATLWADAIEQELARSGTQVTVTMTPAIQSVADDVFNKVNLALGTKPTQAQINGLGVRVRSIATQVTNVNETTRERLRNTIASALRDNLTVYDTAELVRKRIPQIATNRVPTIVRTELGMAADEAMGYAMQESAVVTHIDVIGCEAVEPGIPTYNGIPTCNIKGVPIRDRGMLRFHPNHTGCMVPAAFYTRSGDIPDIYAVGGVGDGIPIGG